MPEGRRLATIRGRSSRRLVETSKDAGGGEKEDISYILKIGG